MCGVYIEIRDALAYNETFDPITNTTLDGTTVVASMGLVMMLVGIAIELFCCSAVWCLRDDDQCCDICHENNPCATV